MQNTQEITKQPLTRRALKAHSWMGLFISAFMYIICLSGTIAVFHNEFERWEQPQIQESHEIDTVAAERALSTFIQQYQEETEHFHLVFPTSGIPRLVVENDHIAHFVNADGSLGEIERSHWTKMLVDMHLYLHLPNSIGVFIVSAFGGLLCAIILSGFLSHPRIIKDAFRLRRGGTGLQENIDMHNRLSVWASPFHLMIGVTGAYFGLASLLIIILSQAFYGGNNQAVVDEVFAPEPKLEQPLQTPNITKALQYVLDNDPDSDVLFLTVHEPNTPTQFIEIYVQKPQRLIYSENYRFKANGEFLEVGNYEHGPMGTQIVFSFYRLHFGDFYGLPSKVLYFILGLMLTVVSATGINIWLNKRKTKDIVNYTWPAIVWGTPVALVMSAWLNLFVHTRLDAVVWGVLVIISGYAYFQKNEVKFLFQIKTLLGMVILGFVATYIGMFNTAVLSVASLQINIPLIIFALYLIIKQYLMRHHQ
ncbi:PepSY domain-containing protein [Alteromonas sp. 5E99-2]|uniref:PepSY-associated TM helix domain-containing protein n=1 Tax=Alteromonas sp. 5E99-2 TaxID=2817683 RepID=UPI001A98AB0B|nr:PepSY-associated TM helix domain-containing protein [Alteromonas sp. 5E99-2]MBO1254409.1 PepSY domain-containing protein [Alteromonas sp. 5E99-2]